MSFKYRKETISVFEGFECDKCTAYYDKYNYIECQELLHWHNVGGYGSIWGDGNAVDIVLCQACTYELLKEYVKDGN